MHKKIISADKGLFFSKAIICNQKYLMEISGQIGLNPNGILEKGVELQTKQAFNNVKEILGKVGWTLDNLIKVRIYLTDMKDYSIVNTLYSNYFKNNFPARVTIAVKTLPLGALIELDCTASGDSFKK